MEIIKKLFRATTSIQLGKFKFKGLKKGSLISVPLVFFSLQ